MFRSPYAVDMALEGWLSAGRSVHAPSPLQSLFGFLVDDGGSWATLDGSGFTLHARWDPTGAALLQRYALNGRTVQTVLVTWDAMVRAPRRIFIGADGTTGFGRDTVLTDGVIETLTDFTLPDGEPLRLRDLMTREGKHLITSTWRPDGEGWALTGETCWERQRD